MKAILGLILVLVVAYAGHAQLPANVPANGLVGWWPFNGNASDESGNGHHGTVSGASLTSDRFGSSNKAYFFNGSSNYIYIADTLLSMFHTSHTISLWYKSGQVSVGSLFSDRDSTIQYKYQLRVNSPSAGRVMYESAGPSTTMGVGTAQNNLMSNQWVHIVAVMDIDSQLTKIYVNGLLSLRNTSFSSSAWYNFSTGTYLGKTICAGPSNCQFYLGAMDDIGVWNRALTDAEILDLNQLCMHDAEITNDLILQNAGDNASIHVNVTQGGTVVQWQSNPCHIGWVNVQNNATYSGAGTTDLNVANVQLFNHMQPFRVVTVNGNCKDTSNVAHIALTDTCLFAVTDTLIIDLFTGTQPPVSTVIKVYPNPAHDKVIIDCANYTSFNGYTVKITNSSGQLVYSTTITQPQESVNLSSLGGNGLYFLQVIDDQANVRAFRKIVLQ